MEYSRVLDLDWLQLYYNVLYEPIRAAAIPVEGGKVIMPDTLYIGADSKIFCTLKRVQIDEPQAAAITARQLYEYEKAHGCNLLKQYSDCGKIYNIYGYIMHAAACELKGKEYAQEWLCKWQAGKAAALNIWRTAAACDERTGKFTLACFQSFVDLENAAPDDDITTYADIDRIRAEVQAICCGTNTTTRAIEAIEAVICAQYLGIGSGNVNYLPALVECVRSIASDRSKGGKKTAAAVLLAAYNTIANKQKVPTFQAWLSLWQYIVEFKQIEENYKPSKLRKDKCPAVPYELGRILYP